MPARIKFLVVFVTGFLPYRAGEPTAGSGILSAQAIGRSHLFNEKDVKLQKHSEDKPREIWLITEAKPI